VVEFSLECMGHVLLFVRLQEFLVQVKWRRSLYLILLGILLAWCGLLGVLVHLALNGQLQSFHRFIFFCELIHVFN
jgi:hypothetical protein